ncbi:hypothetical protein E7Z59_10155 [Robertkochia marina]|uniref:Uncharacterized protein n=1 Tax=Robertkochia marina TaxID=1227945 RepID=A0A4S3M0Q2_9FLAO|nr:hypothetical protein [Robertkochia marina]THD68000.1 hypothetical protein E7Z59_10155 [Robertkochia marina]TRZ41504.1 hypothetical protein D3A96_12955 [Robertkochia marina]
MKHILAVLALAVGLCSYAQEEAPTVVFDQIMLTPQPEKVVDFHKAVAEHNKQFHAEAPMQVAVYQVMTGPNTGKYIWNLGPCTWEQMDGRPMDAAHDNHWDNNVTPTITTESSATYWKYHPEYSSMNSDFSLNMLGITFWDLKRGMGNFEKVTGIIEKFVKLYRETWPEDQFAIYSNLMGSTGEGRDMAIVGFLDNYGDLAIEHPDLPEKYNAMYGEGSFETDMNLWLEIVQAESNEMWRFMPDLSSRPAAVEITKN